MNKELPQLNIGTQQQQQPNYKLGRGPEQTFLQRRHTDGQRVLKEMLNITNHQGNANQNHNEILLHTCRNGCHQKYNK